MEVEAVPAANRFPKALQRITEVALAVTIVVAVVVFVATAFADGPLDAPIQFTPDDDTYTLASDAWGSGTILDAVGMARFNERSPSLIALWGAAVLVYAVSAITLLVLLRGILQSVAAGTPFVEGNARRIRAIGILIPAFGLLIQALQWATELVTMNTVAAEGLHIEASLTLNLTYLFIGLVVVALAEVFRYGSHLQADADLTV